MSEKNPFEILGKTFEEGKEIDKKINASLEGLKSGEKKEEAAEADKTERAADALELSDFIEKSDKELLDELEKLIQQGEEIATGAPAPEVALIPELQEVERAPEEVRIMVPESEEEALFERVPGAEELVTGTKEEREAAEEIEAMPSQKKKQLGRGLAEIGYVAREWKAKAFAKVLNKSVKITGKEQNLLHRFFKSYAEIYEKEAKTAEKNRKQIEMGKLKRIAGVSSLIGNTIRGGRVLVELGMLSAHTLNPFRAYMTGALFIGRTAEAAKEARFKNENVKAKIKIDNPELAMEEAFKLYKIAKKESGKERPSAEDLQKISEESLEFKTVAVAARIIFKVRPESKLREFPSEILFMAAGIVPALLTKKFNNINANGTLTPEQKKAKKEKYLAVFGNYIKDMDRIVTGAGTVDMVSFGARAVEKTMKAASIVLIFQSIEKLVELGRALDIEQDIGESIKSLGRKLLNIKGKEKPGAPPEAPAEKPPHPQMPEEEEHERRQKGESAEKVPDELLKDIDKGLNDLSEDVDKGLEELTKEGEKTSWNIPLITTSEAAAGQHIDYYKGLTGANKEKFKNILNGINQEEKKRLIASDLKSKPEGMSDKEVGMEAVLKRAYEIYKLQEVKAKIPKITGDALSYEKAMTAIDGWNKNLKFKGLFSIQNNKEIYLKICQGKLHYNGKIGENAADDWTVNNIDKFLESASHAAPPAVPKPAPKTKIPDPAVSKAAPVPEAAPPAGGAPETPAAPPQHFEAVIQKSGNFFDTLTKKFDLHGKDLEIALKAKVYIDGKETDHKLSEMGLYDIGTKLKYDKEHNLARITSAKDGRVGTDEDLARVFEKQRKAVPKWLREKLGIEEKPGKIVSPKIEEEEKIIGGESEIKRVPGKYPLGGKVVEESAPPPEAKSEVPQEEPPTTRGLKPQEPAPQKAPSIIPPAHEEETEKMTDILNKALAQEYMPEEVWEKFAYADNVQINKFNEGNGISFKFNDGVSVEVDKDGTTSFTSEASGPIASPLMSDPTRKSVYIEHIDIKDLNINLLEKMKNDIPMRVEAENKILSALKKASVVPARIYKLEFGIDLNDKELDKLLHQETINRVLSGKWTNRFSALTEQAPKQITEHIRTWFKTEGISLSDEEKTVAEVLSKYSIQIAEQIK